MGWFVCLPGVFCNFNCPELQTHESPSSAYIAKIKLDVVLKVVRNFSMWVTDHWKSNSRANWKQISEAAT